MRHFGLALKWAFGIIFLLVGLHLSKEFRFGGMSLVVISLLLLPPIRSLVYLGTKKELSPRVRGAAVLLLVIATGVSIAASQIREARELSAMEAQERIQQQHDRSQRRHTDFFWDETWNHSDYVEVHGATLCAFCHGLEAGDPSLFGPRCVSCHRDIQAFARSIQAHERGTSVPD